MNPIPNQILESLLSDAEIITPPKARISIDANLATPALAAIIGKVLQDAGAILTFSDPRAGLTFTSDVNPSLIGLHIHIGQLTWVRDEEASRWGTQP